MFLLWQGCHVRYQGFSLPSPCEPYLEAQCQTCKGSCKRYSLPYLRLHPLLAFRQSRESRLMLSIYPRNQSSCPAVAGAFFYVNLPLAQASAHTGDEGIYSVFKVRFFRPFVSRQGSERCSPYHIGSMLYGLPPVSHRERAVFLLISLTMRSPLTNPDETREICSESVEFAQRFTKSLQY